MHLDRWANNILNKASLSLCVLVLFFPNKAHFSSGVFFFTSDTYTSDSAAGPILKDCNRVINVL